MQRFIGGLYLTGAFVLAGTSVIAARLVSGSLGPFTIATASLFFAILGLLPLVGKKLYASWRRITTREWLALLLQAICGIFLFRLFLLHGLLRTTAGEAGILTGATPAITVLMAAIFLKEPMYTQRVLGVISSVAGILLVQGALWAGHGFSVEHLIGNVMVLAAATCESAFNVLSRSGSMKAAQSQELDPIVQTTLVAGIAFLLCLGPALVEHPIPRLFSLALSGWFALIWYGFFVTALAFIFWYAGIRRCDASVAAAFSGMMPFTAMLLSVLILGEHPGWQQWLGGLMIVIGMLLSSLDQSGRQRQAEIEKKSEVELYAEEPITH